MATPASNQKHEHYQAVKGTPHAQAHWEASYRQLGDVRNPQARNSARQELSNAGADGARWLIDRVRFEYDSERLQDTATVLAHIGEECLVAVRDALRSSPSDDEAWVLLRAIGWMTDLPSATIIADPLQTSVISYIDHHNSVLREAAAEALAVLAPERAAGILKSRLSVERDEDVREQIQSVLERFTK